MTDATVGGGADLRAKEYGEGSDMCGWGGRGAGKS